MRAVFWGSLVSCFVAFAGAVRADDQADARAVIDKALKAMGGAEKVGKFAAGTVKCKITHEHNGQQHVLEGTGAWQGLDKIRLEGELTGESQGGKVMMVVNGENGWAKKGDQVNDAPEGLVPAIKQGFYALRMPHLLPGLKDKAFILSPLGEVKVDDKDAVSINVNHKDHKDVSVFFDKETGLPVKSQSTFADPSGKELPVEYFYSDYKEVEGVKHPMKITIKADDVQFVVEISEVQPKDKVDDSEFAKP
jgi:hypothetical protein